MKTRSELARRCQAGGIAAMSQARRVHRTGRQALLCVCLSMPAGLVAAEPFTFISSELPVLAISQDHGKTASGPGIDVMHQIASRAGLDARITLYPWARAVAQTRNTPGSCLFLSGRTPGRERDFKWAGPVLHLQLLLLAQPDHPRTLSSLAQARGLKIGAARGTLVVDALRAHGLTVDEAPEESASLKKLLAGRIDLWAVLDVQARHTAQQMGVAQPPVAMVYDHWDGYLACNLQVSDHIIDRLNAAIRSLGAEGAFNVLLE